MYSHTGLRVPMSAFWVKTYARKYQMKEHLKAAHDTDGDDCTRNFICPFICGAKPYRTNQHLLSHCDTCHQDDLL